MLGILNTRQQPPIPAVGFRDEDLRWVQAQTMLLIGGRSVIYDPQSIYRRATRVIPGIQAEIIPDASHALNAEKSELVNARSFRFFQRWFLFPPNGLGKVAILKPANLISKEGSHEKSTDLRHCDQHTWHTAIPFHA